MVDCAGVVWTEEKADESVAPTSVERIQSVAYLLWLLKEYIFEMKALKYKAGRSWASVEKKQRRIARLDDLQTRCVPFVVTTLCRIHHVEVDDQVLVALADCGVVL